MEYIYQAVKNIIIFMLLITVLSNLLGQSSYKKYINIFVGLVLIIIVVTPILKIINSNQKVDQYFHKNLYKINASDMTEQLNSADDSYKKIVLKEYKGTIQNQIEEELKSHNLALRQVDIGINEDVTAEECGQVQSIKLTASKGEEKEKQNSSTIDEVDKVVIDKVDINNSEKASRESDTNVGDKYDTVEELTVKEELSALYGISEDYINVKIN
ncbi:MAG: stage III sporulation protein AF [bacterium]|nr:stage III sporulation protein AF [bacterium]